MNEKEAEKKDKKNKKDVKKVLVLIYVVASFVLILILFWLVVSTSYDRENNEDYIRTVVDADGDIIEQEICKTIVKIVKAERTFDVHEKEIKKFGCHGEYCHSGETIEVIKRNKYIISFKEDWWSSGGAHANQSTHYRHFSISSEKILHFTDLLKKGFTENPQKMKVFSLLILKKLKSVYPDSVFWERLDKEPEEMIGEDTQFYILEDKLYLYFNTYKVSCGAAGDFTISFSLDSMSDYLNSEIVSYWK